MSNGLVQLTSAQIKERISHQKLFGLENLQDYLFRFCKTILTANHEDIKDFKIYDLAPSVLLYGLPNTGKTTLCYFLFDKLKQEVTNDLNFYYLDIGRMLSPELGQSSRNLEQIFQDLQSQCKNDSSVFLLLDELDAFCMSRSRIQEHDAIRRAMTTLMVELDRLHFSQTHNLLIFGITNVVELLDTAVVRRFSIKESIKVELSEYEFKAYLEYLAIPLNYQLSSNIVSDLFKIYKNRKFTAGDIKALLRKIYLDLQCKKISQKSIEDYIYAIFKTGFSTHEHLLCTYKELKNNG